MTQFQLSLASVIRKNLSHAVLLSTQCCFVLQQLQRVPLTMYSNNKHPHYPKGNFKKPTTTEFLCTEFSKGK